MDKILITKYHTKYAEMIEILYSLTDREGFSTWWYSMTGEEKEKLIHSMMESTQEVTRIDRQKEQYVLGDLKV